MQHHRFDQMGGSSLVGFARARLRRLKYKFSPDDSLTPHQRYIRDGGDDRITRRLPLDAQSTALDFGGYIGEWTQQIVNTYGCNIVVFEPIQTFADVLEMRFAGDSRIQVNRFAVGEVDELRIFNINGDGTGEYANGTPVQVEFRSAESVSKLLPAEIALASINIEGGEYELIPALAEAQLLPRIDLIFVQFHQVDGGKDVKLRREGCRHLLSQTHERLWDYEFVWEAWKRRAN